MLITLAGFGNLNSEKPKYLELGCEITRKNEEKLLILKEKKSFKIHMQIMHLCPIGIFVLNVLENLANLGDLVVFFFFLCLVLATAQMCLQVSGFMAVGSVILLYLLLSQNDSQLLVSRLGKVGLVVLVLFTPGSPMPYRSLALRTGWMMVVYVVSLQPLQCRQIKEACREFMKNFDS